MRCSFLAVLCCSLSFCSFGFSQCTPASGQSLAICSPASGATVSSPVQFVEGASASIAVSAQWVYLDNVVVFKTSSSQINTPVNVSSGQHNLRVQTWSTSGTLYQAGVNITVGNTVSCTNSTVNTVRICAPANGASVTSPVQFISQANTANPVGSTWIYVDNVVVFKSAKTASVTTSLNMAQGAHNIRTQTWDSAGNVFQASVNITVGSGGGISVSISPSSASVAPGGTKQFSDTVSGTSNTTVTWSVDGVSGGNATTGTISASGLYTAPSAAGSHTVTVTSAADTTKSAQAAVTVTSSSGVTVTINPSSATVTSGGTQQFSDTVSGTSNTNVTWSVDGVSGGSATAGTISASGLYTAPNTAGSHTVTVTSAADTSKSATAQVTVSSGISITISPTSATLNTGGTQQFNDTVSGTSNTSVTWSVDGVSGGNATIGTISTAGLYTAPSSAGAHTVAVTSVADSTQSASANVSVQATTSCTNSIVNTVRICAPADGMTVSSPVQFASQANTAKPVGSTWIYVDNAVVFKSAKTASVTTSLNIAPGAHNVRTQTWDSAGNVFKAAVNISVGSSNGVAVTVSPTSTSVATGGTATFSATVTGSQNTSVNWLVDNVAGGNTSTGTISASGLYTAPSAAGTHTVTAQSVADTSQIASAAVTVTASSGFSVHPVNVAVTENQKQQFTASADVLSWSVDGIEGGNSTVGSIDNTGLYDPPLSTGVHTITAAAQSDSTTANATVYVENHPGIFTSRYDNRRTGQNTQEIALTAANVNKNTFGKLFSRTTDGYTFTQPLYVPNVTVPGKGTFNVVYLATEHDSVYAFDADGTVTSPLWHVSFIPSGFTTLSSTLVGSSDPGPETGITATPAIDSASGTLYIVSQRVNTSTSAVETHLHALDIATGAEKFGGPVKIQATITGTGDGSVNGKLSFNGAKEHSRPGILLDNGMVYVAFASLNDNNPYHGWVFAYDAGTLSQLALFNASPNGGRAGIWQAGAGLSSDGSAIYLVTGNGTIEANGPDYGDSYVKLSSGLTVLDSFTPFDQSTLSSKDLDLGSSGSIVPPDQSGTHSHILIGSGKSGDIYVLDRDSMGHLQSGSNKIVQYLPRALGVNPSGSDQFFGNGAYWNGNVYFVGSIDKLKQFTLSGGLLSTSPVHQSPTVLSSGRSAEPSVSSNGTSNGIVWVIQSNAGNAVLHAYKATDVSQELYNSTQAGSRDTAATVMKFSTPTVVNGKVFLGTKNELDVYGLLP